MMITEVLAVLAEQAPPGSAAVPWWLRFGILVYGALLVAALMIYAQTKHERPWNVLWILIIAFVPILGAVCYFIAQSVGFRRKNDRPVRGRAETMAPEEYDSGETGPGSPR